MHTVQALNGNAQTYLVHLFGGGLEDDRYAVETFRSLVDGNIRRIEPVAPKGRKRRGPVTASLKAVKAMRPAPNEIIVCTGLRTRGGVGLLRDRYVRRTPAALSGVARRPGPFARPSVVRPHSNHDGRTPVPHKDPKLRRAFDRERFHRRTAERVALGLCTRCGQCPALENRRVRGRCGEKRRTADRERTAKRRAAGIRRVRNPKTREAERERVRQRTAERIELGRCVKCGRAPAEPARCLCAACGERRRRVEREGYDRARAAGRPDGGRDPGARRRQARTRGRQRQNGRRATGHCIRCGASRPVEGGSSCEPCLETRRVADRRIIAARRASGCCGRCGTQTFEGVSSCAPCAAIEAQRQHRKNAAARKRYAERKRRWVCTACGRRPSFGASRCERCARRSY